MSIQKTEKAKEILRRPDLLDYLVKAVQNTGVIGEELPIKSEILVCTGKLTINKDNYSTNLHPEDTSGIGKDFVTKHVRKLVFHRDWIYFPTPTPKAVILSQRVHNVGDKDNPIFETEGQKITEDSIVYVEDADNDWLNDDDNKLLLSDDIKNLQKVDGMRTFTINIKKPVIIVTTAETNTCNQTLRRLPSIGLNSTLEQSKKIIQQAFKLKTFEFEATEDIYVKEAFYLLSKVKVSLRNVSSYIEENLPKYKKQHIKMRTFIKRLLDLICFSATLHQFQREKVNGRVMAQKQDVDIGFEIFKYMYKTSTGDITTLNVRQRRILDRLKKEASSSFSITQINTWKESDTVTRAQTDVDLQRICQEEHMVRINETSYPKTFYYVKQEKKKKKQDIEDITMEDVFENEINDIE